MKLVPAAALAFVAGVAFVVGQALPPLAAVATQPEPDAAIEGDMDPAMAAMMAAGLPGEHHRHLDLMLGTWEGTMTFRMAPDAPPMSFPGRAEREWVLGGRFLRETVKASMADGTEFEGIGYTGYSNIDHRFETTWMDSMSTWIYPGHGTFNAATKVFTFHGTRRDPVTGRVVTMWSEFDVSDPNRHTVKGWEHAEDGSEFLSTEGVFERVE